MNAKDSKFAVCRHLKTNGRRCQSPSLNGGALCFFHRNLHRTHRRPPTAERLLSTWQEATLEGFRLGGEDPLQIARAYPKQNEFHFPPLEDAESVQLASSMLFHAIATGGVHFARARILLAVLKIASINLRALAAAAREAAQSGTDSSTIPTKVVHTTHGYTLAAPGEGNGVPTPAPTKPAIPTKRVAPTPPAASAPPARRPLPRAHPSPNRVIPSPQVVIPDEVQNLRRPVSRPQPAAQPAQTIVPTPTHPQIPPLTLIQ